MNHHHAVYLILSRGILTLVIVTSAFLLWSRLVRRVQNRHFLTAPKG